MLYSQAGLETIFFFRVFFLNELFVVQMKLFLLQAIHQCLTMHQLLP